VNFLSHSPSYIVFILEGFVGTFQEVGKLFHVESDEAMEVFASPDGTHNDGDDQAGRAANDDGGEPLVCKLNYLVFPEARHRHQRERQYEYHHPVVVLCLDSREEPHKRNTSGCILQHYVNHQFSSINLSPVILHFLSAFLILSLIF